jgi:hypothetical protein
MKWKWTTKVTRWGGWLFSLMWIAGLLRLNAQIHDVIGAALLSAVVVGVWILVASPVLLAAVAVDVWRQRRGRMMQED